MATFSVGDIVAVNGNTRSEGEVVEIEDGGYVSVRLPANGTVFAYWPNELVHTGRRIDPKKLASVNALTKALEDAERSAYTLRQVRNAFVLDSIVEVENAGQ